MAERRMGIGSASRRTGLSERQIRYYEQIGLVAPQRTAGRQRLFGAAELARLQEIKRLLDAGQSLQGVRRALETPRGAARESDVRSRLMAGQALRSLYPISNRAELERMISEREEEDDVD